MKQTLFLLTVVALISTVTLSQQRVLLHIDKNGKQETISLKPNERVRDAIERNENRIAAKPQFFADTIRYFNTESDLDVNFLFGLQDIALQWYEAQGYLNVSEFWWRNGTNEINDTLALLHAWIVNPKLKYLPGSKAKWMGTYLDSNYGYGGATPFKPKSGDTTFYGPSGDDSINFRFDPLEKEAPWLPGGLTVHIQSDSWQGIKLSDYGEDWNIEQNQLFGFTLQNLSPVPIAGTSNLEIVSTETHSVPFHSFKFYENGRTSGADKGWWWRPDYEWGMYVVVEYMESPRIGIFNMTVLNTTLKTTPRTVCAYIYDDYPVGGQVNNTAFLNYKISPAVSYDTVRMILNGNAFCADIPGAPAGSTVSYFVSAKNSEGTTGISPTRSYKIFKPTTPYLLIYNNNQYTTATADFIYTGNTPPEFDNWSTSSDGTNELSDVLDLYDNVLLADGSYPFKNVYPELYDWLKKGTPLKKHNLFFTSQDYGCFIVEDCNDTAFAADTFERYYLGIETFGPQNLLPTNKPFRLIPQPDYMTENLINYEKDSSTTLWYYPIYELGFSGYQDAITPSSDAIPLFKSSDGKVMAVRTTGNGFETVFFGFDIGALQMRSDTSLAPGNDPKYNWIVNIESLPLNFFHSVVNVENKSVDIPHTFSLAQNYPNPFNPITAINYQLPITGNVSLKIFDVLGRELETLINEEKPAGTYNVMFNGAHYSSGIYFYQLRSGSFVETKKLLLMK